MITTKRLQTRIPGQLTRIGPEQLLCSVRFDRPAFGWAEPAVPTNFSDDGAMPSIMSFYGEGNLRPTSVVIIVGITPHNPLF